MGYAFGCVPFPSAGVGSPHIRDRAYWVANADSAGSQQGWKAAKAARHGNPVDADGCIIGMGDAISSGRQSQPSKLREHGAGVESARREQVCGVEAGCYVPYGQPAAGPVNGLWGAADWLFCRDGKWRPVEPGTFPLVDGAPARVGRLRAYGNAINAEAAEQFIAAYMECRP